MITRITLLKACPRAGCEAARQRLREVLALFDGRMHPLVTADTSVAER